LQYDKANWEVALVGRMGLLKRELFSCGFIFVELSGILRVSDILYVMVNVTLTARLNTENLLLSKTDKIFYFKLSHSVIDVKSTPYNVFHIIKNDFHFLFKVGMPIYLKAAETLIIFLNQLSDNVLIPLTKIVYSTMFLELPNDIQI